MKVLLLGATGLTGDSILKELIATDTIKQITTISRRVPKTESEKINAIIEKDTTDWFKPENFTGHDIAISAFGTTKAAAGSIEKFKEIDYGTNLKFAETAKANGIDKFVLISTVGASTSSYFPYFRIKGELEEKILGLEFKSTLILRPGPLVGERERPKSGEALVHAITKLPLVSGLLNPNNVEVIAKKLVGALGGDEKVKVINAKEINK